MTKVFIDGSAGTTGLRIYDRLAKRRDVTLITLGEDLRKDVNARKDALNGADVAFLCLPDQVAVEAVSLVSNPHVCVIDTSTAHRVAEGWTYGFPELKGQREQIKKSKRISNPGCHATGFISLVAPLVKSGLINPGAELKCFSLTGYSGGGKKMIADYASGAGSLAAPRAYGLGQSHKHLPEMTVMSGLTNPPVFCPVVSSYYSGMEVTVMLSRSDFNGSIADVKAAIEEYYAGEKLISTFDTDENGFLSAGALSGSDALKISVHGNEDRILLVSRFDNLGKGASGAAIQNMNIVIGADECAGLNI